MLFKFYDKKEEFKRKFLRKWYKLMKPLADFIDKRQSISYKKRFNKITYDQAVKWLAEDIVKYIIKSRSDIGILICDFASDEDFWNGCTLHDYSYHARRDKTRAAIRKFAMTIKMQEDIIDYIKKLNVVSVKEKVKDYGWKRVDNYKKTVWIARKSKC